MPISVLLTGGTGFVGTALQSILLENIDYDVVSVVRSTTKNECASLFKVDNIDGFTDYTSIISSIDVIVHCAARVHIMDDISLDPLSAFRNVNTKGTLNLARQAAQGGVGRFIFLSTIKVNGESTSGRVPFTAFDEPLPEDFYGVSKFEAEKQLLLLGKETGMEIVIIRPPLVYGQGVKANFASLMSVVGKGVPLPFRSIYSNKRSLVSVYNLVDLIKVCIDNPKAANQIFLVSDDEDLSTARIIELMAKVQGKTIFSLPLPIWCFIFAGKLLRKEAVIDRLVGSLQLDIEHTKSTLKWVPPYSVEHGFRLAAKKMS